jgi:pimeloyl-ACP methyl ester carboxylesterase
MTTCAWTASGTLMIDAVRLEYACLGPAPDKAPTLVLLHEGLGSIALWRDFPSRLQAETGLGVFVYSRQGYGRSDPIVLPRPFDYHAIEAVDVLPKVLDAIGLVRGLLVGHSDGATIAALHAARIRDPRLAVIVLMAPHFFVEQEAVDGVARANAAYAAGGLRERLARYHDDVDGAFHGWSDTWGDPAFRTWSIEADLDAIDVPVMAIQGEGDDYGTLAQFEPLRERVKARFEPIALADCGHVPFLDQPELTRAAIGRFCQTVGLLPSA